MKQPRTIQEHFNAIQSSTGSKDVFLKEAKRLYSRLIPNAATFEQTVKIFKNRGILNENYIDLKPISGYEESNKKEPWEMAFKSFLSEQEESIKAETKKASKYETDAQKKGYDNSDVKNLDNQVGQEVLNGIAFEARENPDKTLDEIRSIVSKNLAKDPLYYVKNAMFGIKGVGVSDEIPGLKASKSDQMVPVKMQKLDESKKPTVDQRLKEIHKESDIAALESKLAAIDEEITKRTSRITAIDENEDLAELVNPVKLKEMKKEVKYLEKERAKHQKLYERLTGTKPQEIIDENDEEINVDTEDDEEAKINSYYNFLLSFDDHDIITSKEDIKSQIENEGGFDNFIKSEYEFFNGEEGDEEVAHGLKDKYPDIIGDGE